MMTSREGKPSRSPDAAGEIGDPLASAELRIEDLNAAGAGVGRLAGKVVFVPGAVPGDVARVVVESDRGRHAIARLIELVRPSASRVEPPCPHQSSCGGCPLMTVAARAALEMKSRRLVETVRRIGGLELPLSRVIASPQELSYRGRVRFAVGREPRVLGFRPAGEGGSIAPVDDCAIAPPGAARLARRLLDLLAERGTSRSSRWPRELEVRASAATGERLLVVHGPPGPWPELTAAARAAVESHGELAGVARVTSGAGGRTVVRVVAGRREIREVLAGFEVEIGATGFLQVNRGAAELMYDAIREDLDARPGQRVLDLYCGVGLMGLVAGSESVEIVGIDADEGNVRRARRAARRAGRPTSTFVAGDASLARGYALSGERFERVAANPPRAGLSEPVVDAVALLRPERLVLASCHPASLARDLRRLADRGYAATRLTAVDMFPQTAHLEAVVCLEPQA